MTTIILDKTVDLNVTQLSRGTNPSYEYGLTLNAIDITTEIKTVFDDCMNAISYDDNKRKLLSTTIYSHIYNILYYDVIGTHNNQILSVKDEINDKLQQFVSGNAGHIQVNTIELSTQDYTEQVFDKTTYENIINEIVDNSHSNGKTTVENMRKPIYLRVRFNINDPRVMKIAPEVNSVYRYFKLFELSDELKLQNFLYAMVSSGVPFSPVQLTDIVNQLPVCSQEFFDKIESEINVSISKLAVTETDSDKINAQNKAVGNIISLTIQSGIYNHSIAIQTNNLSLAGARKIWSVKNNAQYNTFSAFFNDDTTNLLMIYLTNAIKFEAMAVSPDWIEQDQIENTNVSNNQQDTV